jgi:hypothetical protein
MQISISFKMHGQITFKLSYQRVIQLLYQALSSIVSPSPPAVKLILKSKFKNELKSASLHIALAYFQAALRGFLVVLALSLHEIFEGVALGLFSEQVSTIFRVLAP